ncbi:helix-turn-helix domain-containing protein [Saccharomonospora iraqiensis]|uniref:helix-turn-helix domain-containing protein n=1 Tax=Saccharomonospora iraqiensis TaxID=52698 RepID=UPI0003F7219F|nr:Scr1 family TA system antitoxin-like transcriptional regulator [Saccharomonospora iraqiensis]
MTSFERRKTAFGERLRQLRGELNAKTLAADAGWPAHKQSKIENGKQLPTEDELARLLHLLGVADNTAEELRAERSAIEDARVVWRQRVRAGYRARQQEAQDLEANATTVRAVEFSVVPGLLQTADYAAAVLTTARSLHGGANDITDAVRERMRRQQVLYEPGKTFEFLLAEAALWHPVAPPEVMAAQIHRLIASIGTPNVRLGIVPARTRVPIAPMHGYWILDEVVLVEDLSGERRITDPGEVDTYYTATDLLWDVAVEGDQARTLLAASSDHGVAP